MLLESLAPSSTPPPEAIATNPSPATATVTSTATGRRSTGLQHPPSHGADGTPDRRRFAANTDDAAIFIEDTVDRVTAQCMSTSPSALAILSPQRLPEVKPSALLDVTDYDPVNIGTGSNSLSSSVKKGRRSGRLASEGASVPTTHAVRLSFGTSPNPKADAGSRSLSVSQNVSTNTSQSRCTPGKGSASSRHRRGSSGTPSPGAASTGSRGRRLDSSTRKSRETVEAEAATEEEEEDNDEESVAMVSLAELERVERERNRFEKMYEHQRALYDDMAARQAETYSSLQEKIVEVVALSTRNEESKRYIRQLKKETAESRTRVMDIQNKTLEEARAERRTKSRYEALLDERDHKYRRMVERNETKLAGMESLLKDLTCVKGEHDRIHVSQLDALLKAAYAKSTALFSDLMHQTRQIDLLYDAKEDLEKQLDQMRREKRDAEATMREERRRMMTESERFINQIEDQQQSILNLRQMLIRTLDVGDGEGTETDMEDDDDSDAHSGSTGSSSIQFDSADMEEIVIEAAEDVPPPLPVADAGRGHTAVPTHQLPGVPVRPSHADEERARSHTGARPSDRKVAVPASTGGAAVPLSSNAVVTRGPVLRASATTTDPDAARPPKAATARPLTGAAHGEDEREIENGADAAAAFPRSAATSNKPPHRPLSERIVTTKSSTGSAAPAVRVGSDVSAFPVASKRTTDARRVDPYRIARAGDDRPAEGPGATPSPSHSIPAEERGHHPRKRLDFSTALAAVSAKRENDRVARERSVSANKENHRQPASAERAGGAVAPLPVPIKRQAVEVHVKGRCEDVEDEDDDAPRLVPRQRPERVALSTISQRAEKSSDRHH